MDKKSLTDIINNEDKPLISLSRLAEKFHNQPYAAKVVEAILGGGLSLATLTSCGTVIPPPPVEDEVYLNVPVIKQEKDMWCIPASAKSVLNYAGMEITQSEIAKYCMEGGVGYIYLLANNAEKLGIDAYLKNRTLEEIKEEITNGRPPIVGLDYSLTNPANHAYVIDGFSDTKQEVRLMCPLRGYIDMSYDEFKKLNDQTWGQEWDLYSTASIWPKDKAITDSNQYREEAIKIVNSQIDSILGKPEF